VRCYQLVTLVMTPSNDPSYDKPSLLKGGISHILIDFDSLQFLFHCIFSNIGPYKPYIFRDHKGFISRNGYDAPSPPLPLFHIRLPKPTQDPTSCRLSNPIKGEVTSVFLHCTETSSPPFIRTQNIASMTSKSLSAFPSATLSFSLSLSLSLPSSHGELACL
jgi:hypothetical protein